MSLNWREIDQILAELKLEGAFIQDIVQPDYSSLLLKIYSKEAGRRNLYISLKPGKTRIHTLEKSLGREIKLQRFAQLLRSRLKGCRIERAEQIAGQRLVEIRVRQGDNPLSLWLRLWGNAANILLCREEGEIIDAFYRRPKKGEESGASFRPRNAAYQPPPQEFTVRPFDAETGLNRTIEEEYTDRERTERFEQRRSELLKSWRRTLTSQESLLESYRRRLNPDHTSGDYRHYGDLILANLHLIKKGERWASLEDYQSGADLSLELDPRLTPQENAEAYYAKERKREARRVRAEEEIRAQELLVRQSRQILDTIEAAGDVEALQEIPLPQKLTGLQKGNDSPKGTLPGLLLLRGEWQLLVGRNAKESDTILRSWAKGNDYWVHTRDYPGGHIFLRGPKGKSVPLEVLLDAGNLAVHYSKAKSNGRADCYYTRVKYLRRPRDGKIGTVLPTQEKNLDIQLDPMRIEGLLNPER